MKNKPFLLANLFCFLYCSIAFHINADDYCNTDCQETSCCEGQFFLSADWLYMKAQEDNLVLGFFVDDFPDPIFKSVDAKFLEPTFTYDNGFRVDAGYQFPCQLWQINVNYTYLPFQTKTLFNEGTGDSVPEHQQFISTNTNSFPVISVDQAFLSQLTNWHGNFSNLDVDFSRNIDIADCFRIRPHVGFRTFWMDQTLTLDGALAVPSINESMFARIKMNQKLQSYGIEGGCWSDFFIGYGFSIVGHVGGSVLYSDFKVKEINRGFLSEDGNEVFLINSTDRIKTATPTMEYLIGLRYSTNFSNIFVSAHAGWEQRIYFDLNRLAISRGNFSVQGLNAGLTVSF